MVNSSNYSKFARFLFQMKVFYTKKELNSYREEIETKGDTIGLVPTMGALHKGHLSLVKKCLLENDIAIVSIFVNPTQFNNPEDLKKYPKTLNTDLELLKELSLQIAVFAPSVEEMYASGVSSKSFDFGNLENVMEGAFRPGHFDGVGTIVEVLLRVVQPHRAYFGEKDYQQLLIIKKLVSFQDMPVEIIGCPIVRESGGLAFSSRNKLLSEQARNEANIIYTTLLAAKIKFGTKSAKYVMNWVIKEFKKLPQFNLEYISITNATNLTPVSRKRKNVKYRAFIAVYAEGVRLIDNIALN